MTGITDKFEQILAVDLVMALIETFQDSHEMTAHNLLNMHLAEEMREFLPEILATALFSLVVSHEKPHRRPVIFYAVLFNSLVEQSKN